MRCMIPTILLALLLCISANLYAQATGRVSGRVLDQTGAALPGVTVDLVVNSHELTAVTDETGAYEFDAVPPGNAELTFRLLNFSVLRRSVSVASGSSARADIVLTLSLSADVLVTGIGTFRNVADVEDPAANLVGIASAASQGAVTAAQLEERPIMRAGEVLETVPGRGLASRQLIPQQFEADRGVTIALLPEHVNHVFEDAHGILGSATTDALNQST